MAKPVQDKHKDPEEGWEAWEAFPPCRSRLDRCTLSF